jgi:hypothetical protein
MMRVGLFKAVHVKIPASQHRRLLLTSRKLLQRKIYDIENDLRAALPPSSPVSPRACRDRCTGFTPQLRA